MLKFTVAEPVLGLLTFSLLLGPPVRSSVHTIEEGTLFCLQGLPVHTPLGTTCLGQRGLCL